MSVGGEKEKYCGLFTISRTPGKKECNFCKVSDYRVKEGKYEKVLVKLKIIVRMKNFKLLKTPLKITKSPYLMFKNT